MDASPVFAIRRPKQRKIPLIISTPHVGTEIPTEILPFLNPELAQKLPDTDWFVDDLYSFWEEIGAVLIRPRYSRYVVDLNRPTSGPALYNDARRQTAVIPLTSFGGIDLYENSKKPDEAEFARRVRTYHEPYYRALARLITETKDSFGKAILFDAHSITRYVPSIRPDPFPDMIVGDRDGSSAAQGIGAALQNVLKEAGFQISYNEPFKGGEITRHHGVPAKGEHAIQLEMSQDVYLDENGKMDAQKLARLQPVLKKALLAMVAAI